MLTFEQFKQLAQSSDIVPVYHKIIADIETPVSILARVVENENIFLLESVESGERFGRYSFIGVNPKGIFTIESGTPYYYSDGKREVLDGAQGAFMALKKLIGTPKVALIPDFPPLFGGAIGFLGYETVNQFEKLPLPKSPSPEIESAFLLTDEMIIFDNLKHIIIFSIAITPKNYSSIKEAYNDAVLRLNSLQDILKRPLNMPVQKEIHTPKFISEMTKDEYIDKVEKAKKHIFEGDIIQVVLSQKFSTPLEIPPLQLYRALRMVNPSPYTFFLKIGAQTLVGSSPETLVKLQDGTVTLRPIAGTRPRGQTPTQDRILANELLQDEKERAEHLMLVDLGRNDLGRIAVTGSVQVKDFMMIERYSHVMHLVSTLEAIPRDGIDAFELIRASFPAGTLSGAPKIRAMEIIHDLEPHARGTYGGAVGYLSYNGNMDLAITIRTLLLENQTISVQSGAGIVYDSDPEKEYQECCNKASGMMRALELASNHFKL